MHMSDLKEDMSRETRYAKHPRKNEGGLALLRVICLQYRKSVTQSVQALISKADNLENRSRRNNLPVVGVLE